MKPLKTVGLYRRILKKMASITIHFVAGTKEKLT